MTGETTDAKETKIKPLSKTEKQAEHMRRIQRTAVASFMGILVGVLSYILSGTPDLVTGLQPRASLGILLLIVGIVFQKYIFLLLRIDQTALKAKDWFYQSFMTFAFWYISWAILLTPLVLSPPA
jgi:hypothetical protein